jgi:hypothetical protein
MVTPFGIIPTVQMIDVLAAHSIGVGKVTLPALRTVRAVLPHTALQSLVSSSGVSRFRMGCL